MRYLLVSVLVLIFLSSCATLDRTSEPIIHKTLPEEEQAVVVIEEPAKEPEIQALPELTLEVEEKLEDMVSAELHALEGGKEPVTFDVPVTINKDVQTWITYFLGRGQKHFVRALGRSTRYLPLMKRIFREEGLPEDLVYLSLIESHFMVSAYSRAHAAGLWQFISPTARRYGLKINGWVDERRHPEKSTRAATAYLSDLHEMFGSWYLAAAAYNAGENKIKKSLKRYKAETFWEIAKKGHLRRETRNYVPKFLAAVLLAKDPERYGLTEVEYEPPLEFDEVQVSHPVDLGVIARLCGCSLKTIRSLNPEIRAWYTPLNEKNYKLWVPKGTGDRFRTAYARLNPNQRLVSTKHKVVRGETLGSIARLYGLSIKNLRNFNKLRSDRIYAGSMLRIPAKAAAYRAGLKKRQKRPASQTKHRSAKGPHIIYQVKPGDNPWQIARRFNLDWRDIAAWNDIKNVRRLMPGQELVLYLAEPGVRLASAAKIQKKPQPAAASATLRIPDKTSTPFQAGEEKAISYTVRSGDTLWAIARRFNIAPKQIRAWNNIKTNLIRPGDVLTLKTEQM
ncbi:MAG: LysM peptidoglycan-binding domain-containing protein [Deltaproteobacteria bacterium]|nr:LysM peptidoglycan-binding domain-containing protein [Deltaproteobacteria bacterium]